MTRAADDAIAKARRRPGDGPVVCASGISPSGPVHLGNLREILVPHLVAEEIRSRGVACEHILSWDDYDRLRKVPAGVPADFAEHVGRPLSAIPDPWGEFPNWAERFKTPFRAALRQLGIEVREISQTEMYRAGAYADGIARAIAAAGDIDAILGRYRTLTPPATASAGTGAASAAGPDAEVEPDEGAAEEESSASALGYFPYRPYCDTCGRDTTTVTAFDPAAGQGDYTCESCGHHGRFDIRGSASGKLVWKVDWPMRWAFENVAFEAGGVDHSSPGSSFTVGGHIVREIFGGVPPEYLPYSFVGVRGRAKLSGSAGGAPTPADALQVLEPAIVRWVYARRKPNQAITVDFGQEVLRVYDEWDALNRRAEAGSAEPTDLAVLARSRGTVAGGPVAAPSTVFPFRLLSSICDITADDATQILRIVRQARGDDDAAGAPVELADLQPRLDCARTWTREHVPADQRTIVRTEPDQAALAALSADEAKALAILVDELESDWSLDGLTALTYAVPKLLRGLPADAPATAELKQAQRAFFVLVYQLLVGRDTGPRLPTLLLSLGAPRIRTLLTSAAA
ncbi:lysine--tRNA ligase [Frankia sp. AgB32]|uniref:lysine--tRNA ligase n=1 Tax=Frankia sp. AgB32 TaxID=631119 RepID=UPI00200D332A|nr:lysine--tRNA ligase [Frankia sp. AgB32]MCK9897162.1 lysine--tRNA ligase [Frankia sp. AgB32]